MEALGVGLPVFLWMLQESQIKLIEMRFIKGLDISKLHRDRSSVGMRSQFKNFLLTVEDTHGAIIQLLGLNDGLGINMTCTQSA